MIGTSEKLTVFTFLQEQKVPLIKKTLNQLQLGTKERKKTAFIATYLALFPGQPSRKKFDLDLFDRIEAIRKCFQEILEKNRGKQEPIDLSQLPITRDFFNNKVKSTRITNAVYLQSLSAYSYGTLPSPACGLRYPLFPSKLLKEVVEERKIGLNILISKLELKKRGEEKEESKEEKQSSVKEDFALAKLLYSDVALGTEDKNPIFFHDLLVTWAEGNSERETCIESIFQRLNIGKWSSQELQIHKEFKKGRDGSFQQFLISCTMQYVEEKLGFPFLLPTLAKMQDAFQNEQVRAHVAYFVALEDFAFPHRNLEVFVRDWITSLQIFNFFRKKYGVASEKMAPLLEMILSRSPSFPEKQIQGFSERNNVLAANTEDYTFTEAWNCMESCLESISGQEAIQWYSNSEDLEKLLVDPELFLLLVHLLTQKQTWTLSRCSGIFSSLKDFVKFSVSMVYAFFKANPDISDPEVANDFSQSMSALIKEIKKRREDFVDFAFLCFTPPMAVANLRESKGREVEVLDDFFDTLPEDLETEEIQTLLRCRIEGKDYLFMLCLFKEDLKRLEIIDPPKSLIMHILTSKFQRDKYPSAEQRREALAIVMQIQESILLPKKERFDLYLEVLRLKVLHQEVQLRKMSAFIEKLRALCPSLNPLFFFYLLIHHPDPPFEALEELVRLREEIIREDLGKLYIPHERSQAFVDKVEEILNPIADSFPRNEIVDLKHTLVQSALCFFQPITDQCKKVANFEFQWQLPGDVRHWGRFKPNYREKTYSNWNLTFRGFPQLFMMVYDPQRKCARSASVVLEVHKSEFDGLDKERQKDFMHCLMECSDLALHENEEKLLSLEKQVADPHWSQNEKVRQKFLSQENKDHIVEFVKRVKISSRSLFFPEVEQKLFFNTLEAAAQGWIYPIGRGSLLPPSQYLVETHRECYLPDTSEEFFKKCIATKIFSKDAKGKFKDSEFSLHIMGASGKKKIIEVSFEVFTEGRAMRERSVRQDEDIEETADQEIRYFVLSFTQGREVRVPLHYFPEHLNDPEALQYRFDVQNLTLKSLAYQYELSKPQPVILDQEEKKTQ